MSFATPIFLVLFLIVTHSTMMCCSGEEANANSGCVTGEMKALLKLKASFSDASNRLSSWDTSTDCCKWIGVECDNLTGHVIALDLQNKKYLFASSTNALLSEMIDSSILELEHLSYVDLSGNDFLGSPIPEFFGLLNQLRYLDLSRANFTGVVPHHLGNLSRLSVLDLSFNGYSAGELVIDDFTWFSRLSLLRSLDLSFVNLNRTEGLLKVLNLLPSIEVLHMAGSKLENRRPDFLNTSLSNIQDLDLRGNSLHGELPYFLENMTSLRDLALSDNHYNSCNQVNLTRLTNLARLDLSSNHLYCNVDSISQLIQNNCQMESLELGYNHFFGDISSLFPLSLSRCPNHKLATLDLGGNNITGHIPTPIGAFRKLKLLDLGGNNISGHIPTSIGNLKALATFDLSANRLNGSIPLTIGNLKALEYFDLSFNQLSGHIPSSLGNLRALWNFDLSHNKLIGNIPLSLGNHSNPRMQLYMSNNNIEGSIPDSLCRGKPFSIIDLSRNRLSGDLPGCWWRLGSEVQMSWNKLSGGFPESIGDSCPLTVLNLLNNQLTGGIPATLQNCNQLYYLDVSRNHLSGKVPHLNTLRYLALSSNEFSGDFPTSFGEACTLEWLQLRKNKFTGELPSNLRNCTKLIVMDVGENKISGELPDWIGNDLLSLNVLILTTNKFHGAIPSDFCQLSRLHILDLSNNHLTGNVPHCFGNFSGMVVNNSTDTSFEESSGSLKQVMKGKEMEYYHEMFPYVVNMDLSCNNLTREIPWELTGLAALIGFNLSHNHLQGHIPQRIGDMNSLESLDLSNNNLIGQIPGSLSNLKFLSQLNLSHNKLTGQIPTGSQLQTFQDPSIYEGNPGLCGDPLVNKCPGEGVSNDRNTESDEAADEVDTIWFVGVVISGFATGLWGAIGVLVFKRSWRSAYFGYADEKIAKFFGR